MLSLKKAALALTSVGALALSAVLPQAAFAATDGTITFTDDNATATVKLVDDKGNEIGTFKGREYQSLDNIDNRAVALKDAAPVIPNYYLTNVCVDDVCESDVMEDLYADTYTGPFAVKDGSQIRLVYTPYTPATVATNTDLSSTLSKEAVDNGDGTYTQTGTFKIANGKTSGNGNTRAVDVLFLIDESGSMDFDALEFGLTNALNAFSANKSIDVNFGLVTLADYGRTVVPLGARDVADVQAGFAAIKAERQGGGGDDLSTGLVQARHELVRARVGAQKVVVFLGDDGAVLDGSGHFIGDNQGGVRDWSPDVSDYSYQLSLLPLGAGDIMYVAEIDSSTPVMEDFSKLSTHKSSVVFGKGDEAGFFDNFRVDMVALEATNIAVTDTLSDNVELVSKDITLTVTDASGRQVASGKNTVTLPATSTNKEATLTASVSTDGKTITVAFPADYKSEDGWSYSFSEQLTLSASAPTGDAALVDKSHPNTGTWADSYGLFTSVRESSKVTYRTGSGMDRTDLFPMPVVVKLPVKDATTDPTPTPTTTAKPAPAPLATTGAPVAGGLIGGLLAAVGLYLVGMRRRALR